MTTDTEPTDQWTHYPPGEGPDGLRAASWERVMPGGYIAQLLLPPTWRKGRTCGVTILDLDRKLLKALVGLHSTELEPAQAEVMLCWDDIVAKLDPPRPPRPPRRRSRRARP